MKAKVLVSILALVTLITVGCTRLSRGRSDAETAQQVSARIQQDTALPNKQITVNANQGVVTLSGTVGSEAERQVAGNDAAQIDGVRTVVNNLQVQPQAAQITPAAQPEQTAAAEEQPAPAPPVRTRKPAASRPRQMAATSAPAADTTKVFSDQPTPSESYNAPPAQPAPPPAPKPIRVPSGTTLSIRMIDSIDTAKNQEGDPFRATLDAPVMVGEEVVIPANADVQGRVAALRSAGHFTGKSQLALELTKISFGGKTYAITTDQYAKAGSSRGKNTAEKVGAGAAVGAVLGGIFGGGKGAAIGATVGAGAGGGVQAATHGEQIKVPSEALLRFRLENEITVTPGAAVRHGQRLPTESTNYDDQQP